MIEIITIKEYNKVYSAQLKQTQGLNLSSGFADEKSLTGFVKGMKSTYASAEAFKKVLLKNAEDIKLSVQFSTEPTRDSNGDIIIKESGILVDSYINPKEGTYYFTKDNEQLFRRVIVHNADTVIPSNKDLLVDCKTSPIEEDVAIGADYSAEENPLG